VSYPLVYEGVEYMFDVIFNVWIMCKLGAQFDREKL